MDLKDQFQKAQHDLDAMRKKFGDSPEIQRIEKFFGVLSAQVSDMREETNAQIQGLNIPNPTSANPETVEATTDQLIEHVVKEGRLRGYAGLGLDYAKKRGGGNSGFGYFKDPRSTNNPFPEKGTARDPSAIIQSIGVTNDLPAKVKGLGADAAIGISKVMREENVYEEMPPKKGLLSAFSTPKEPKIIGKKYMDVPLGKFDGSDSNESAFQLVYCVTGGEGKFDAHNVYSYTYADPVTGRSGNFLLVSIILPEDLARKVWKIANDDPTIVRRIVEKMDPELIADQESRNHMKGLPGLKKERKMLLIPESEDAAKFVPIANRATKVVDVHWQH